jgi:alkylation response protein AidB-like acyl-CoA dehydrogenase
VAITSEWARDREQFGRPIGDFQSVAYPLADVAVRTRAARNLVRSAAYALDHGDSSTASAAATARLSAARAALDATYRAHQAFGALGFTVEGPVAGIGQHIRQISLHPPGAGAAREAVLAGLGL